MNQGRPTHRQIAIQAKVSHVTVSLALRGDPSIPEKTRERIEEIARSLDYRPDPEVARLMSHLRTGKARENRPVVGFVDPTGDGSFSADEYVRTIFLGACERATELGYHMEAFRLKEAGMTARKFDLMMQTRNIKGLLLPPMPRSISHISINWRQYAAVALTHSLPRPNLHRVCPNHYENMTLALRELRRLGYRRPGFVIAADMDQRVNHSWKAAFLAFQSSRPERERIPILLARNDEQSRLPKWIRRHRPDVVISGHWEFFELVEKSGFEIPAEMGFVTMAMPPLNPELACINENAREVGRAGMDQLASQLQYNQLGIPAAAHVTMVQGAWQAGRTVRRVANDRRDAARRGGK